jgi:fermentation-respiration switch protein FrsA (DUF1100 family)
MTQQQKAVRKKGTYYVMIAAALVVIVVGYLALLGAVYLGQSWVMFPDGQFTDRTPTDPPFGWRYEDLYLSVDHETTHAWHIPVENAPAVVLFSHGNGGSIPDWLEAVQVFHDMGLSVLIYDYGGYGTSTGRASEERCYADIRAAWRYLTEEQGVPPNRIALFGRSLGGAVAAQLATEITPGAVILESTFLSVPRLAGEKLPVLPMNWLMRNRFDTAGKVSQIKAPILIVHSPDDTLIPYHHGRDLFDLANEPKQFLQIRGDHNEGWLISGDLYLKGLAGFLAPLFREPISPRRV